jgi:phosphatidylglycerophosphate synthase
VTLAVLYAGPGNSLDPADAVRLADDLTAALRAAGASEVDRVTVGSEMATLARDEPVLLCADNLVAHPSLLWTLATEPAGRTTALVVPDPSGDLRDDRGRVVPAADGTGTARFAGAIMIAPADLPVLARSAGQMRSADDLLPALLANGLVPIATPVRLLHAEQVRTTESLRRAQAAVAAIDEDRARLRLAVKEKDDFFTTYAVSSWSPRVTKIAARLGLTPTAVTGWSVLFAVAAALCFWQASRPAMILGGVLLYLGFVLDCVDGQLARYTRTFSTFGGWLDTMADRAKEYAAYAGLAAGADRIGLHYAWPLAITAILMQTVRHMTDTWYGALHDEAASRPRPQATGGVGAKLSAASNRVQGDTGSAAYWLKRIVVFPIGERWALIALLAIFTDGRVALTAVVGWGALAFAYTLALRSLRSLSMKVGVLDTVDTMRHRDDGLLTRRVLSRAGLPAPLAGAALGAVGALGLVVVALAGGPARPLLPVAALLMLAAGAAARARHGGPLDWLVPAGLRAGEYLLVVAVGVLGKTPPPVVFLLLFLLALRHYDLTARMEKGAPAGAGGSARLGWDGRVVVLAVAGLTGWATLGEALLSVAVAVSFLDKMRRDRGLDENRRAVGEAAGVRA